MLRSWNSDAAQREGGAGTRRVAAALVVGAGLVAATSVAAADDPITSRQHIMKNNGAAMGVLSKMVEGEMEFDATSAMLALRTINSGAIGLGEFFPEGSESGGETRAAPAIWEDMGAFEEALAKFEATSAEAVESPPQSQEELAEVRGAVGASCGGCHETFRLAKQ